jgi:predicted kinase
MQRSRRQAVFVSGAPGAGKTSLAVPLAAKLGFALVSKDRIKETLHDALGAPEPDLAWSRTLGAASMELLWALAADAPSVVVEANFRPRDPYQRGKLTALADDPVEVYCRCDPGLAARRYRDRVRTRHPVHVVTSLTPGMLAEYDRPVGIGRLVTVDTAVPSTPRRSPPPSARAFGGQRARAMARDRRSRPGGWQPGSRLIRSAARRYGVAMRVEASREAAGFVRAHGGRLWVWAAHPRMCCAGTPAYMHAATEAPPGLPGFTRAPAAGLELWFRARGGIRPDVLEIGLRGRRRPRVEAYWDGCLFALGA